MSILFTFLPWIAEGLLSSISLQLALGLSLFLALVSVLKNRYIMEWTTFLFFLVSFSVSIVVKGPFLLHAMPMLSSATLSLIAWISLLRNKPFTLPYAKKRVPEKAWSSPLFLKVNQIITAVFGSAFSIGFTLKISKYFYPELIPYSFFSYFLSAFPFLFVLWFPNWYKKRAQKKRLIPTDGALS